MVFVVHHVTGQSAELGVAPGDIILSVGAQKFDGSEKEEDIVLQIQNSQRPLEMIFNSHATICPSPDQDAGDENKNQK